VQSSATPPDERHDVLVRHAGHQLGLAFDVTHGNRVLLLFGFQQLDRHGPPVELGRVDGAVRAFSHVAEVFQVVPADVRAAFLRLRRGTLQAGEVEVTRFAFGSCNRGGRSSGEVLPLVELAATGEIDQARGGVVLHGGERRHGCGRA